MPRPIIGDIQFDVRRARSPVPPEVEEIKKVVMPTKPTVALAPAVPRDQKSIPESQTKVLGKIGGRLFVTLPDGEEYQLATSPTPDYARTSGPGIRWITRKAVDEFEEGGRIVEVERTEFYRAALVATGTYQALVDKAARRHEKARAKELPKIVSAFRRFPILNRQADAFIQLAEPEEMLPLDVGGNSDDLAYLVNARRQRDPSSIFREGRRAAESWGDVISVVGKYVLLDADSGSGQVRRFWRSGRLIPEIALILDEYEVGIRSVLTGHPLKCMVTVGCPRNADRDADGGIHWCGRCDGHDLHLELDEAAV